MSHAAGPTGELATRLLNAIRAPAADREHRLDEITVWLRHAPPAGGKDLGDGWHEAGQRLDRVRDGVEGGHDHRFSSSVNRTQLRAAFDARRWMMSRG